MPMIEKLFRKVGKSLDKYGEQFFVSDNDITFDRFINLVGYPQMIFTNHFISYRRIIRIARDPEFKVEKIQFNMRLYVMSLREMEVLSVWDKKGTKTRGIQINMDIKEFNRYIKINDTTNTKRKSYWRRVFELIFK